MVAYYFNWHELKTDGDNQFEAILVLLYASIIGYNNKLGDGRSYIQKKLNINRIDNKLFYKKHLRGSKQGIYSNYKCKEPQSYFINSSFLTARCPIKTKIHYLFMLGHRNIMDKRPYILKEYIEEKYWNNLFIRTDSQHIYFEPEELKLSFKI